MAILRVQEKIKKADGTYDTVHKETEAGLVLFDDNETFQQKYDAGELNGKDGKSPYQQAVEGGYTGTEAEFKAILASGPWLPVNRTEGALYGASLGELYIRKPYNNNAVATILAAQDLDENGNPIIELRGSSIDGPIKITNVHDPDNDSDAVNKKFVEDTVANAGSGVTYGTCSSASSTAAKVVSATGFTLKTGSEIWVKFTNANTAGSPTLNVNSTGAKYIKKYGTTSPSSYMWAPGAVVGFVYDGTYWIMVNGTTATTSYYGVTKLNSSVSSSSTTEAATPNAVKEAYDRANSALQKTGGDMGGDVDMNNHFLTGLPSPVAPSDAVNYQTLINAVAGIYSFAIAEVKGYDWGSGIVTKKAGIFIKPVVVVGNDTIIYLKGEFDDLGTLIRSMSSLTVTLPTQFNYPSSGWSDLSGYAPSLCALSDQSQSYFYLTSSNGPLTFGADTEGWQTSKLEIQGYVRVGVNA